MHPSGMCYEWAKGLAPDEVEVAPLPEPWIAAIKAAQGGKKLPTIVEGQRNDTLFREASLTRPERGER